MTALRTQDIYIRVWLVGKKARFKKRKKNYKKTTTNPHSSIPNTMLTVVFALNYY